MSKQSDLAGLLDTSGNVKTAALSNAPDPIVKQSTAPSSPSAGDLWLNTTNNQLRIYNGTAWDFVKQQAAVAATGGTVTTSGGYKIHTFTSSGTFSVSSAGEVEYFIIAGGGGGNHNTGTPSFAGGGAGGVVVGSAIVSNTSYSITVGAGGSPRSNGSNSSALGATTAIGGGRGGDGGGQAGASGGSGGGQGGSGGGGSPNNAPGTAGQGNAGGSGTFGPGLDAAGGGGGYSSVGQNASGSTPGNGGLGYSNSWTGTEIKYAGGGGRTDQGYRGGYLGSPSGSANSGSGGAGTQGSGGSGIVVIRYPL